MSKRFYIKKLLKGCTMNILTNYYLVVCCSQTVCYANWNVYCFECTVNIQGHTNLSWTLGSG